MKFKFGLTLYNKKPVEIEAATLTEAVAIAKKEYPQYEHWDNTSVEPGRRI